MTEKQLEETLIVVLVSLFAVTVIVGLATMGVLPS